MIIRIFHLFSFSLLTDSGSGFPLSWPRTMFNSRGARLYDPPHDSTRNARECLLPTEIYARGRTADAVLAIRISGHTFM